MRQLPYESNIDALVFLAKFDKEQRELKEQQECEKEEEHRRSRILTLENILIDVCKVFEQDINAVRVIGRKAQNVTCRRLYFYLARTKTAHSLIEIANYVGGFDHTTVIHHAQTVQNYLKVQEPKWMLIWNRYLENSTLFNRNDFK